MPGYENIYRPEEVDGGDYFFRHLWGSSVTINM